jgi:hypothetical protein
MKSWSELLPNWQMGGRDNSAPILLYIPRFFISAAISASA